MAQFITLSVHLSRAKLITRFDDRYAVAKFSKSGVLDKVPEGSVLIFGDNRISFKHSVAWIKGSSHAENQLDSFSRFDRTPTCDRQTDEDTGPWLVPRMHSIAR